MKALATLPILVVLSFIIVIFSTLVSAVSYNHYLNVLDSTRASSAFLLADSAMEEVLLGFQKDANYSISSFDTPEGTVDIDIQDMGNNVKDITVTTEPDLPYRQIHTTIELTGQLNPLDETALFSGDDVKLVKNNSELIGNLWTNDNINLDENTVIKGDVFAAGAGSNSSVRNGARIIDNPATPEIEGNLTATDPIRVLNNGLVEGTAKSKSSVNTSSGGTVGNIVIDPDLVVGSISIPVFEFDDAKTAAQLAGTYYNSPASFLAHLQANSYTLSSGVYYIASTTKLTLGGSNPYDLQASIIAEGIIEIEALDYTHLQPADSDFPVLASKKSIDFVDKNACACEAYVEGVLFAQENITLKHDQYNGSNSFAVEIVGALWAGDDASIEDRSRLVFDPSKIVVVDGFNFTGTVGNNNIIEVQSWTIN